MAFSLTSPAFRWLALAALAGLGHRAAAQQPVPTAALVRTLAVKASLTPLLAAGYHLSLEKTWSPTHRHSLSVTPQLYHGRVSELTSKLSEGAHDRVRGFGLDAQYRRYLDAPAEALTGVYLAAGPHVQRYRMEFQSRSWQLEAGANGLTYYEFRLGDRTETITRLGATAVVGKQIFMLNAPVFLDLYVGLGWRTAWGESTASPTERYASGMSDYGHEGFFLPVGVKLGVAL